MSGTAILITSIIFAVAWLPIGYFFWRAWRQRGAPLSLAICGLVGFPVYTNVMSFMFLGNEAVWIVISLLLVNGFILINFAVCFRLQIIAFPNARKAPLPSNTDRVYRVFPDERAKRETAD